jgi:hypothetical protein
MVKPMEAALHIVNCYLLLCNLFFCFETPGSFTEENNTMFI